MAESRKRPDEKPEQSGTAPSGTESAASQVLRGLRGSVKAELRDAAETASLAVRIGQKTREISDLRLKLKLRKLGGDYSRLTGDKK